MYLSDAHAQLAACAFKKHLSICSSRTNGVPDTNGVPHIPVGRKPHAA
jgi:hypothetical protein